MSKSKGKGKSKGSSGTGASSLADTFVPLIPPDTGSDQSYLPFPEWTDQSLNAEKWDKPKGKAPAADQSDLFADPQTVNLPSSISACNWKRLSQVFPDAKLIMFADKPEYPDLTSASKHLLHSDFMRSFIAAITTLEYLGNTNPFPIEYPTATFTPTTQDLPWRPWHHIYSMCKAGKGQKHNPQVNQLGKYVVRLFWMGSWRKITIDDTVPIGTGELVQIPGFKQPQMPGATEPPPTPVPPQTPISSKGSKSSKKTASGPPPNEVEVWPYLLCKALLKIASLTWTVNQELVDFDIVHCLTGWILVTNDLRGMNFSEKWDMCAGFTNHYDWEQKKGKDTKKGKDKKGKAKTPKGSKASKGSKKGGKSAVTLEEEEEEDLGVPCYMYLTCTNMRYVPEDRVPEIAPCWSHNILVDLTRMIPLVKPQPQPELENWKHWRWVEWAAEKGIYIPPEDFDLIKFVKIVSAFKKVHEHILPTAPSIESVEIIPPVVVPDKGKKGKDKGKDKGKGKDKKSDKKSKSDKTSKSSKSGKKGKASKVQLPPDPSIWSDFHILWEYMDTMLLYYRPSRFTTNYKISNLTLAGLGKDAGGGGKGGKKDKKGKGGPEVPTCTNLVWRKELLPSRNEPLYIFMDSLDYKLLIINLVQTGDVSIMESLRACGGPLPFAYAILENYNWRETRFGEVTAFVNTYGLSASLTNVDKGRHLFRLWLRSDTSFVLNILSDVTAVIGNWEKVLHFMQGESERLTKLFHDVSSAYGQLVQKFGTAEYASGLRNFYTSYKSDKPLSKINSAKVHDKIIEQILKTLKEIYTVQEYNKTVFAFKVLFINPYIIPRNIVPDESDPLCDKKAGSTISFVFAMSKKVENAAVIIQAFFKRVFVKKLKEYHNQSHKNYMATFLLLKKIYTDLFSVSKRSLFCAALLRNVFFEDTKHEWNEQYSLFNDLFSVVHLQCITGIAEFKGNEADWVYITRVTFHCNSPDPILVKIQLFCMLPHFMVRVFDNDTDKEMYRFTNNVNVQDYNINEHGYSVLCYGWSETNDSIQWKLCFATVKKKDKSLIILSELKPELNFLCGVYIPNYADRLFRCKIVTLKTTLVSFRLSVSCSTAKITLKLLDENDKVMGTIEDYGCVIFPMKILVFVPQLSVSALEFLSPSVIAKKKGSKPSSSKSITFLYSKKEKRKSSEEIAPISSEISYTTYFVEGYVIKDSWELLPEEWVVADEAKKKKYLGIEQPEDTMSSTAVSRKSSKRQSQMLVEKKSSTCSLRPFWLLHFIAEEPENIVVAEDPTRDLEIANSKKAWLFDDPERAQRGIMLRLNYLLSLQKQAYGESEGWDGGDFTLEMFKRKRYPPVKETPSEIYNDYLLPPYEDEEDLRFSESRSRDVLTEENIQEFLANKEAEIEEYERMLFNDQTNRAYLIAELKNRREFMNLWFEEVRNESMELMKDALAIRQRYIDWLIKEEENKVPPPKADDKKKGKGKDKKGKKK